MVPSIYHYNTIIKSLSLNPASSKRAIILYKHIRTTLGLFPNTYTLPFVLKAVTHLSNIKLGAQIHSQAVTLGLYRNVHVSIALIKMYSHCGGKVLEARKVFNGVSKRDVTLWNAMVAGYVKVGEVEKAREFFEEMPYRNVISWTSVIAGYAQKGKGGEAISVFRRMQESGVEPDEVTMLAVLSACAQLGALELGKWVDEYIERKGLRRTLSVNNALVDMYSKSGDMGKALEVFENMKERGVVTWTTMIGGLAAHGMGREALKLFSRMERDQVKPNGITFVAILSACSHAKLVEEGQWLFKMMKSRFEIRPRIEHYGCMVDLLGRSGCLKEAEELLTEMPFQANSAIWGSLLNASRNHGDVALAEKSLRKLIMLEPHNSGNYLLLSNLYASHGRWDDSGIMRKVMKDAGVRKAPGSSFIEANNKLHEFSSGEKSHPEFALVDEVLSQINQQLVSSNEMGEEQHMLLAIEAY